MLVSKPPFPPHSFLFYKRRRPTGGDAAAGRKPEGNHPAPDPDWASSPLPRPPQHHTLLGPPAHLRAKLLPLLPDLRRCTTPPAAHLPLKYAHRSHSAGRNPSSARFLPATWVGCRLRPSSIEGSSAVSFPLGRRCGLPSPLATLTQRCWSGIVGVAQNSVARPSRRRPSSSKCSFCRALL